MGFILFMSVTNTDALLLLPWKYDDTKLSFISEQTGFPSKLVFSFSLFRLIEDGGQAALQTSYLTTHSGSLLTWVSMAFSWASIAYLLIHKFPSGRSASICARNSELNVTIETGANVLDVYVYVPLAGSENKK